MTGMHAQQKGQLIGESRRGKTLDVSSRDLSPREVLGNRGNERGGKRKHPFQTKET